MDEAVLRIVLQDAAQGPAPSTLAPPPNVTQPQPISVAAPDRPKSQTTTAITEDTLERKKTLAGADILVEKQDYAREILAGAQEDLEKFQEHHKSGNFDLSAITKSAMKGDVGGMMKGTGMSAAAMEAALPVAGIVGIAKMLGDKLNAEVIGGIKSGIGAVGGVATSIANVNEDVTAPMAQLGNATTELGEKIVGVVPVLGYMAVAAGEAGKAFATLMQAIDQTAKHYEQYSVDVAMAAAQAEVRQTMRDMSRAQKLGTGLADFVTAKSKLENDVEDIKTQLLVQLLPVVVGMVRSLDYILIGTEKTAEAAAILADIVADPTFFADVEKQKEILERIHKLLSRSEDENIQDPTSILFSRGALTPELDRF